jgi:hypothetical protein
MDSTAHLLEGDGVVSNLFFFLWKFKSLASTPSTLTDLCIPSTVVLEHNFPKAWYYNADGDAHDLERKLGRDVDTHLILRDFCDQGGAKSDGVVACYYSNVESGGVSSTRVEFFDVDGLHEFLLRRTRRPDGFLQKWVPCSSKFNTVIQAIWSPHLCIVRKRQNRSAMRDKRESLFERCVTYEGATHLSEEAFVAPHIQHHVEAICKTLVDTLYASQKLAVHRMVLHFKVDSESSVWLLYCSSMRIGDRTHINLAPNYVRHADDEVSQQQQAARTLTVKLRDEGYERFGTAKSFVPVLRLSLDSHRHPLNVMHPRPPSMGPIGDTFDMTPRWNERAMELRHMKQHGLIPATARHQNRSSRPAVDPRTPKPPLPKFEKRKRRPQKPLERRGSQLAAVLPPTPSLRVSSADGHRPPTTAPIPAAALWRVVQISVLSGSVRTMKTSDDVTNAMGAFLYAAYSHFTCSAKPFNYNLPSVFDLLPPTWWSRIGISATENRATNATCLTVLALGLPLLRIQSLAFQLCHDTFHKPWLQRRIVLQRLMARVRQEHIGIV